MSIIDIYRLIYSISNEEETIFISGSNFFDFCLELENLGIIYEFSEYSLRRFESQFKSNVEFDGNELRIYFSDDFRRTLRLLNQNNSYILSEAEIREIWKRKLK